MNNCLNSKIITNIAYKELNPLSDIPVSHEELNHVYSCPKCSIALLNELASMKSIQHVFDENEYDIPHQVSATVGKETVKILPKSLIFKFFTKLMEIQSIISVPINFPQHRYAMGENDGATQFSNDDIAVETEKRKISVKNNSEMQDMIVVLRQGDVIIAEKKDSEKFIVFESDILANYEFTKIESIKTIQNKPILYVSISLD